MKLLLGDWQAMKVGMAGDDAVAVGVEGEEGRQAEDEADAGGMVNNEGRNDRTDTGESSK